MFTFVVSMVLFGFTAYHLSLIYSNITTYEEFKWERYHRTGGRAVSLVARERKQLDFTYKFHCMTAGQCKAEAADTRRLFGIETASKRDKNVVVDDKLTQRRTAETSSSTGIIRLLIVVFYGLLKRF